MSRSENRVFLPQAALDEWIVEGSVELQDGELAILSEDQRFSLTEAVRVVSEVSESGDPQGFVGRAKPRALLDQMGAEIVESSMLFGDAAYDIVPGWFGVPAGGSKPGSEAATCEEVLERFLAKRV